ncbi:MAG: hypothetical protein ACKVRN_08255 [Pyrinomonadaceae bacterium]
MFNKGLLNRVLPFLATFAFGIFVASFFVSIGSSHSGHQRGKCRKEVQRLREENLHLHYQLDSKREEQLNLPHFESEDWGVPAVEDNFLPPPPMKEHKPKAR